MSTAKCYAENSGMKGHWDEELRGLNYLVYAYLQQARDETAKEQLDYLQSMEVVSPINNKGGSEMPCSIIELLSHPDR